MRKSSKAVVADTTTLSNFARSGHLNLLQQLLPDGVYVTSEVVDELRKGVEKYRELEPLLEKVGTWLEEITELTPEELQEQARLKQSKRQIRRGADSGLIALAKARKLILLSDDSVVRQIAESEGVKWWGTADLLRRACQQRLISKQEMDGIARSIAEKARYGRLLRELAGEE